MGGKSMGSGWKGRMCWAVTSVAVRVAGSGFSAGLALVLAGLERGGGVGRRVAGVHTSPCSQGLGNARFDLLFRGFAGHCIAWWVAEWVEVVVVVVVVGEEGAQSSFVISSRELSEPGSVLRLPRPEWDYLARSGHQQRGTMTGIEARLRRRSCRNRVLALASAGLCSPALLLADPCNQPPQADGTWMYCGI